MTVVQKDINSQMRAILVDWLVEVADEYHLQPETLYICVRTRTRSVLYGDVCETMSVPRRRCGRGWRAADPWAYAFQTVLWRVSRRVDVALPCAASGLTLWLGSFLCVGILY